MCMESRDIEHIALRYSLTLESRANLGGNARSKVNEIGYCLNFELRRHCKTGSLSLDLIGGDDAYVD